MNKLHHRVSVGLLPEPSNAYGANLASRSQSVMNATSLNYIRTPKIKTQKELQTYKKNRLLTENDQSAIGAYDSYLPPQDRIHLKENLRREYFETQRLRSHGSSVVHNTEVKITGKPQNIPMKEIKDDMKRCKG